MNTWSDTDGKIIARYLGQLRLRCPISPMYYRQALHSFQEVVARRQCSSSEMSRDVLEAWLREPHSSSPAALFALLADRTPSADDAPAPDTGGLPREWARALSAPFVLHPGYGTRCSTLVLQEPGGWVYLAERRFDPAGELAGETEFQLKPGEWP